MVKAGILRMSERLILPQNTFFHHCWKENDYYHHYGYHIYRSYQGSCPRATISCQWTKGSTFLFAGIHHWKGLFGASPEVAAHLWNQINPVVASIWPSAKLKHLLYGLLLMKKYAAYDAHAQIVGTYKIK
jgi:hypothetical protein